MATLSAIARPYAQAAYEFAQEKQDLAVWDLMLQTAAKAIQLPVLSKLLSNDRVSPKQWFSLLCDILKPCLNEERKNFLRLLTENKRIAAFPDISEMFRQSEILNKQASEVEVITAVSLDTQQEQQLAEKLSGFLGYKANLRCQVDEHILGGALVRAGDKVIDGSLRGQLTRLLEFAIR